MFGSLATFRSVETMTSPHLPCTLLDWHPSYPKMRNGSMTWKYEILSLIIVEIVPDELQVTNDVTAVLTTKVTVSLWRSGWTTMQTPSSRARWRLRYPKSWNFTLPKLYTWCSVISCQWNSRRRWSQVGRCSQTPSYWSTRYHGTKYVVPNEQRHDYSKDPLLMHVWMSLVTLVQWLAKRGFKSALYDNEMPGVIRHK